MSKGGKHPDLLLIYVIGLLLIESGLSTATDLQQGEYCLHDYDTFSPKCIKNEVILIKSALFGRMKVGKCITAEEVRGIGPIVGEDPRYLGCSADVLPILDEKCSGKSECEIRVVDIPTAKSASCFPGLKMYLEVTYACVNIADESRSCEVTATAIPVHIIVSQKSPKMCGTGSQPWIVETVIGKRIKITLIELNVPSSDQNHEQHGKQCYGNHQGVIIDRVGKRNTSICREFEKRETVLHSSSGNTVNIILHDLSQFEATDSRGIFLIKVEAIGCSDIVPPEDTWLKRNNDVISIGCYSNRQTWRLNCQDGKWIGVLGNCSMETVIEVESAVEQKATISEDEQVLAIVAIVGCTLAICMAIVCTGAVCLRRFYVQSKRDRTYKTLSCNYDFNGDNTTDPRIHSQTTANIPGTGSQCSSEPQIPTYSVYVGDGTLSATQSHRNI